MSKRDRAVLSIISRAVFGEVFLSSLVQRMVLPWTYVSTWRG